MKALLLLLAASFNLCAMDASKSILIDIAGLDKAEVLQALFTCAKHVGDQNNQRLSWSSNILKKEEIEKVKNAGWKVGYMKDRVLQVDLCGNMFSAQFYDEANGKNAAQAAIEFLKKQKSDSTLDKK